MLLHHLRRQSLRLCRQGQSGLARHVALSRLWALSLLGKKEAAFLGLVLVCGYGWPEFYGAQLFVLGAVLASVAVMRAPYRLALRLCIVYFVLLNSWLLAFEDFYKPGLALAMDFTRLKVMYFTLVLVPAVMIFVRVRSTVFGAIAVIASVLTLMGHGITYVTTMNTAFLAVLLPFVPPIFLPLPLYAIYLEKGALSYGIVALHLLVFGIYYRSRAYWGLFLAGVVFGGMHLGVSIYCSARGPFALFALHEWLSTNVWFGNGLGSFQILGPILQKAHDFDAGQYWLSLHNEWIQALVETGVVGFALLLWVLCDFLWRNRREPILVSTMLGLAGCGVFYYPFKIPIFALVFAVLISEGMRCPQLESMPYWKAKQSDLPT